MGITTHFFVANLYDLIRAFPNWVKVSETPVLIEVANPITGKKQPVLKWVAADDTPIGNDRKPPQVTIHAFPNARFKQVDHAKLSGLIEILTGLGTSDVLHTLVRPALLKSPSTDDEGLDVFPSVAVKIIAEISEANFQPTAVQWAATKEMKADMFTAVKCEEVLRELNRLADVALGLRSGLYLYWCL